MVITKNFEPRYPDFESYSIHMGNEATDDISENRTHLLCFDNLFTKNVIIMVRTQISLSETEYAAAKAEAERLGISLAELLRRSLREMLRPESDPPWMRYAGMVESGDSQSSVHVDEIVYGNKD